LIDALEKAGVTQIVAQQIIREYPLIRIETQVGALKYRKANDPAAVLVRSIQEDWKPPASYQKNIEKNKKQKAMKQQQQKEEKEKEERRQKIEEYLSSLSRDELADLTGEAKKRILDSGSFFREHYRNKEMPAHLVKSFLHIVAAERLGL